MPDNSRRRLHLGCGPITPLGWINCDIQPGPGVDLVADVRAGLPLPSDSLDCIVGIHVLPEIPFCDQLKTLSELRRLLRPGGVLRLGLPDMDLAIQAYRTGDVDYFLIGDEVTQSLAGKMIVQLTWYGRSRCMFTWDFTRELLTRAGFGKVTRCAYQQSSYGDPLLTQLDDRPLESLFVEAVK
ncbi:MAG: methyltransferase domain-containing protein [Pirellulaceae bacterium]|nr:methyltransferase domain-containing protein [Pirellulaceae bacterium]